MTVLKMSKMLIVAYCVCGSLMTDNVLSQGSGVNVTSGRSSSNIGFRWSLGITASQGSGRSISSQSPSLTVPNGGYGYFANTTLSPFVTGIVPVVNAAPISPVQVRWQRLQYERSIETKPDDSARLPRLEESVRRTTRSDDPPLILKPQRLSRQPVEAP